MGRFRAPQLGVSHQRDIVLSGISVIYKVLCETKANWKKKVSAHFSDLEKKEEITINNNLLNHLGWKVICFEDLVLDKGKIEAKLDSLIDAQYKGAFAEVYDSSSDETYYYARIKGKTILFSNENDIQESLFEEMYDENLNFFNLYEHEDKVLIRLKPNTKKIHKELSKLLNQCVLDPVENNFTKLKMYIDSSVPDDHGSKFNYPNIIWKDITYKSPDNIEKNICFFYDDGNYIYVGYKYPDLSMYLDYEWNHEYEGTHIGNLVSIFGMLVKSSIAKARSKKLSALNEEAYFFEAGGVLYYKEQPILPESIWGEVTSA